MFRPLLLAFYALAVLTHLLVILRVIPWEWVNGGRSESYTAQAAQSGMSAVVLVVLFAFVWRIVTRARASRLQWWLLLGIVVVLALGTVLQLLGTRFEREFLSFVLLTGVVGHALLAADLRPRTAGR